MENCYGTEGSRASLSDAKSVDKDGTWLKKNGKFHFGYKKHHVTDDEGLVLGVCSLRHIVYTS
jgi:IS5 family transposase